MKTFGQIALVGFSSVVLFKVLAAFVAPLLAMVLKVGLIMALGYAVLTLFKRARRETTEASDATA